MHESRNKMQPEISLGSPPRFSEERVIITVGAALFSTRWLIRRSKGWALLRFPQAGTCYVLLTRPR